MLRRYLQSQEISGVMDGLRRGGVERANQLLLISEYNPPPAPAPQQDEEEVVSPLRESELVLGLRVRLAKELCLSSEAIEQDIGQSLALSLSLSLSLPS